MHWILTNVFATYADILTSASSTSPHDLASAYHRTLPYRSSTRDNPTTSVHGLSPGYFRRKIA